MSHNIGIRGMLSFGLVPTHLNVLHPGSLCLHSSLSGMVTDVVCRVGKLHIHMQSPFDVTPLTLAEKVLVHLVLPRHKVVFVKFLNGKRDSHLSIHDGRPVWSEFSSSSL